MLMENASPKSLNYYDDMKIESHNDTFKQELTTYFRGRDVDTDSLGPFEMVMGIGAFETEKYDFQNQQAVEQCIIDDEKAHKLMKEKLLKQPMKRTLKRQHSRGTRESKLMSSAMKALDKISSCYDDAKREDDEGIFEKDVITELMEKKKQRKQRQKVVKNSATSKLSPESEARILKRKLKDLSNKEWIEEMKNRKKKLNDRNLPPIPSLLEEFEREIINKCGGIRPNHVTCIIQKPLYITDLSPSHNRITMPCSQIGSFEFLKDTEMTRLRRDETITVPLIHKPRKNGMSLPLTETPLELKQWNLHKNDSHKENPQYVLRTAWKKVVLEDELGAGDIVQIWAYRNDQDKLCMALVKLDIDEESQQLTTEESDHST